MADIDTAATQRAVLMDIEYNARLLKNHLESLKRDADRALDLISNGLTPDLHGFGPIGHQAPFDVATTSAKLMQLFTTARMLQIDPLEIQAAYEEGTK